MGMDQTVGMGSAVGYMVMVSEVDKKKKASQKEEDGGEGKEKKFTYRPVSSTPVKRAVKTCPGLSKTDCT